MIVYISLFPGRLTTSCVLILGAEAIEQKDGGRPQRGGQERGDMENQEADQKFRSCPWVSN